MKAIELETRYSAHNYEPLPVVLARGQGAHLWDIAGRRYVDMMSAYSAASHGHAHPRILAALTAQAKRLAVPSRAYYNERLGPFLEELCKVTGLDAALPMNTAGSPPFSNQNTRECSRNRPSRLRTRMFSLSPGTPGRIAQIPRTTASTGTPACEARYRESMITSSTTEFIFSRIRAGRPSRWCPISRSIRSTRPLRSERGATSSRR